ncbi:MAG: hypothetical protein K2Y09_14125 [Nitrosomonas sp.]|uniref:hypothetical protein n=1 Tax=Nitrosomonas sp. TaxID=42353 RepID=UPI001D8D0D9E|nr:hypothetical protein [Nitrosomonas sp.]MBX9896283.1 hypothetical protein [Nitrosomonas sp.]
MELEHLKKQYKNSLSSWFLFDYCLPIFFIVVFWPVALFLLKIPYAFEQALSTADLIPIASLLMLAASREIELENKLNRISDELNFYRQLGIFFPIPMLSLYSLLKYYSLSYQFPAEENQTVDDIISLIP